jgi:hypothetical protein
MTVFFGFVVVFLSVILPVASNANSCTAKKLKVRNVCGVVVDGAGVPIKGATLQLVSLSGATVSGRVSTGNDGSFRIDGAPTGDLFLSIEASQHNSGKWPLKVTGSTAAQTCKKTLVVHLAACLGCGCGDWVGFGKSEAYPARLSLDLYITQYQKAPTFAVRCESSEQHTYRTGAPL